MKCRKCGHVLTVHIARSGRDGFWNMNYCERCGDYQASDSHDSCVCGTSFASFIETGFLGCEKCYVSFSERLNTLLVQYRGRATADISESNEPLSLDRIAYVRGSELREMLEGNVPVAVRAVKSDDAIRSHSITDSELDKKIYDNINGYILSMRIRIARNVKSIQYTGRLGKQKSKHLADILFSDKNILRKWMDGKTNNALSHERSSAFPRSEHETNHQGYSEEFPDEKNSGSFEIYRKAYAGDEDHLRMQWIIPFGGLSLEDMPQIMDAILNEISEIDGLYSWQYSETYGYLTSCPGNSGTGMRISFRMNVRGLKNSGNWNRWKKTLRDAGLVIRGHRGEGSPETEFVEISSVNSWNFHLKKEFLRTTALIERILLAEKKARKI